MQPGAGGLSGEFAESTEIMYTTIIINGFWSSLSNYRTASRDVLLVSQHVQLSRRTRMCESTQDSALALQVYIVLSRTVVVGR